MRQIHSREQQDQRNRGRYNEVIQNQMNDSVFFYRGDLRQKPCRTDKEEGIAEYSRIAHDAQSQIERIGRRMRQIDQIILVIDITVLLTQRLQDMTENDQKNGDYF